MNHEQLIRQLDCWDSDIVIHALDGGITNHNYIVTPESDEGRQYVVRLGSDIPVHHIMRFNEIAASKAAHAAGLSPAIRFEAPGVLVMDFIAGGALTPEQVSKDAQLQRIVPLIKQCHNEIPKHLRGASIVFWVFHVIRDYAASLRENKSVHVNKLPALLSAAELLEQAAGPFDIVFGHNDLLAANILDDGARLWLIDWEYGGFTTPLFDLGGLASNNGLSQTQERWMLQAYFGRSIDEALWHRYHAMKTASLLRETLWSMISEVHSSIDFDYAQYTAENLSRFETALTDFKEM